MCNDSLNPFDHGLDPLDPLGPLGSWSPLNKAIRGSTGKKKKKLDPELEAEMEAEMAANARRALVRRRRSSNSLFGAGSRVLGSAAVTGSTGGRGGTALGAGGGGSGAGAGAGGRGLRGAYAQP